MGKLLQVRVSASTVEPGRIEDAWPILCHLAYPPAHGYAPAKRGVLELVDTLHARLTAGEIPPDVAVRLKEGVGRAVSLCEALGGALAAWKPGEASALTEKIEDALDELEDRAGYR
jgi:hypothetical protein